MHPDRNAMELLPTSRSALPSSAFFDSLLTFLIWNIQTAFLADTGLFKRIHIDLWKRGQRLQYPFVVMKSAIDDQARQSASHAGNTSGPKQLGKQAKLGKN